MILVGSRQARPGRARLRRIVPEFNQLKVLDGFDGTTPRTSALHVLRRPCASLQRTRLGSGLRILESGCSEIHAGDGPPLDPVRTKEVVVLSARSSIPAERWDYGIGIDWLGQVVEVVDGRKIERFCREEIYRPTEYRRHAIRGRGPYGKPTSYRFEQGRRRQVQRFRDRAAFQSGILRNGSRALLNRARFHALTCGCILIRVSWTGNDCSAKRRSNFCSDHSGDICESGRLNRRTGDNRRTLKFFPWTQKGAQPSLSAVEAYGNAVCWLAVLAGVLNTHCWFDPEKGCCSGAVDRIPSFRRTTFHGCLQQVQNALFTRSSPILRDEISELHEH